MIETPLSPARQLYEWFVEQRWDEELYLALANNRNGLIELSDGKVVIHTCRRPHTRA